MTLLLRLSSFLIVWPSGFIDTVCRPASPCADPWVSLLANLFAVWPDISYHLLDLCIPFVSFVDHLNYMMLLIIFSQFIHLATSYPMSSLIWIFFPFILGSLHLLISFLSKSVDCMDFVVTFLLSPASCSLLELAGSM